ncbi:hypothetical protein D3C87_1935690 [compost metagenome]
MDFGIDRVHGNGFHFDQQIVLAGLRHLLGNFNKNRRLVWINGDSFNGHGELLMEYVC